MRLSLKMLFHWVCKRTADYPRSQARGLNGLESLGGSLDFGGDPSLVPYDNLNPWDYGSSGCVSTGHLSLGESASGSSNYCLLDLNQDVVRCILEEALLQGCLIPLSVTCKAIREASKPILFKRCQVTHESVLGIPIFPPTSLWRHIMHISLVALRPSLRSHSIMRSFCDYLDPDFLSAALHSMHLLRGVSIWSYSTENDGLPWPSLKAILATPQLRELALNLPASGVMGVHVEDLDAITTPPLISLTYRLSDSRAAPRWLPTERAALACFLEKVSHSLQSLTMSSESAPLDISLELVLTLRPGVTAPILCPSGYDAACPWPHLQSFTTCHPNLEDEIYRHLPPTLRRLLFYSYPYYGNIIGETSSGVRERQLQGSLLTASQILELLSRCQTPDLTELAVEFFADDQEFALWRFLPRAFPRLTSLTIHIYRAENAPTDTLVPRIAQDLARLTHLTTLRTHLGFAPIFQPPMPLGGIYLGGSNPRTPSAAEQRLKAARDRAARTFADALSSSLCNIFLLHPLVPGAHWIQYRILPWKRPRIEHRSRRGQFYELRCARGIIRAAEEGSDDIM